MFWTLSRLIFHIDFLRVVVVNHRIGDWGTQRRHRVKFEIDFGLYLVDLVLSIVTQCVSGGIGCLIHQVLRGYWVLTFRLWILGIEYWLVLGSGYWHAMHLMLQDRVVLPVLPLSSLSLHHQTFHCTQ